ncbi:hypothetical protein B0H17DRAFT_916406 [Mycena rosella]|uniref:Uncharacterized protein n=1 Tax=Mycena rosella TaxID=1033263 RepID=A0AAD7H0H3_MYCRO|nr:hypothetical protein B0H17DRAFT_916406 [Mycena rosella]
MAHYNFNAGQPPPGRYATASYLLGMGPLPPPTNRELAVAYTQAGLDSGMFAQPQFEEDYGAHNTDDENTHAQPPASGEPQIDPTLLALSSQGTGVVIPADIPADDFFSRIHARMNVDPATAILGWKESQERRRDPHRRLETAEDLGGAFKQLIALQKSSRRKKPVIMEIANLEVQPDGKTTKQAEKQSETAISIPELEIVKAKLTCALHPGRNRWCYVMPPDSKHPGEHIALGIEHVGLWARKVHDGEASDDCINPPNVLNFDQMAEKGRAREERIAHGRGQAALPPIHVHVGSGSEHTLHDINPNLPTSRTKRAREVSSDSSSDDDDDDALTITDVLQELDKKYPALQYLQYSPALAAKGIVYASSALGFDHAYYKDNVGMADGAIGAFVKRVGKMVRAAKKRNGKKQARTAALDSEKEN